MIWVETVELSWNGIEALDRFALTAAASRMGKTVQTLALFAAPSGVCGSSLDACPATPAMSAPTHSGCDTFSAASAL